MYHIYTVSPRLLLKCQVLKHLAKASRCHSHHIVKNGRIHNKKPKYQCQNCQRQFVEKPTKKVIAQETLELINRLLLEKIPLAGITRAAKVSETWLPSYVNDKYIRVSQQLKVSALLIRTYT